MLNPELKASPQWRRTGNVSFPAAARVEGSWWVLRINDFPDHPFWTVFVNGARRFDIDDVPPNWGRPLDPSAAPLEPETVQEILTPIQSFVAYGSEVGQPCDKPFCCG